MSEADTETSQAPEASGDDKEALFYRTEWDGRRVDWLLQWLVNFVSEMKLEVGISLNVGGSIISGDLVSHAVYFEQLSNDISAPFGKIASAETADMMKKLILAKAPGAPSADDPAYQYLHLKNCQIFTDSDKPIPSTGVLWRGKISAIDGFFLGKSVHSSQ